VGQEIYDVFVSYSRADWRHAADVDAALRARGLKPFFDRRSMPVMLPEALDLPFNFLHLLTWIDLSHVAKATDAPEALEALLAAVQGEEAAAREAICPYRGLDASGRRTRLSSSDAAARTSRRARSGN
jgi:hypothetical protein